MEELEQLIEETANAFYQQRDKEGYEKLDKLLAQLMLVKNGKLMRYLLEAMAALEAKDIVLLADILLYEVKEQLS